MDVETTNKPPTVAELQQECAQLREQVASLTTELAETNHGVVALYAELDDRAEQLKQATELKSRFLAYMSHEFRTPLSSIRSLARILLDRLDGPLTSEQAQQVTFISSSAAELSEMVDDLLDLAKVEAGRIAVSPAWFTMVDLFGALRGMFKPMLGNSQVVLVFDEPHNMPEVFSDDKKIAQILRNYISNALKFTTDGEVRVSAVRNPDETITFSVRDTGVGIRKEDQAAIFEDFVQVNAPIQKHFRGTGLGLALSKKFATLLGGTVGMQSELGVGSTFWVTIPEKLPGHSPDVHPKANQNGGKA